LRRVYLNKTEIGAVMCLEKPMLIAQKKGLIALLSLLGNLKRCDQADEGDN